MASIRKKKAQAQGGTPKASGVSGASVVPGVPGGKEDSTPSPSSWKVGKVDVKEKVKGADKKEVGEKGNKKERTSAVEASDMFSSWAEDCM